ncbi:MAG: hypothetical protein HXS54_12710 [Theionarchaea archaeon]|nr:hypothetical protein [Theionarchaea archaeon]
MESNIEIVSYKLGLITAIYSGKLVNFAIRSDIHAKRAIEESSDLLQDILRALGINITLPDLDNETQIMEFFRSDFSNLLLSICRRLDILYSEKVSNIFIFSNSMAGYLLAYDHKETIEEVKALEKVIPQLGRELNIGNRLIDDFLNKPNEYWDKVVEAMLNTPIEAIDIVGVKIVIGPLEIDLNRAAELIRKYLRRN